MVNVVSDDEAWHSGTLPKELWKKSGSETWIGAIELTFDELVEVKEQEQYIQQVFDEVASCKKISYWRNKSRDNGKIELVPSAIARCLVLEISSGTSIPLWTTCGCQGLSRHLRQVFTGFLARLILQLCQRRVLRVVSCI